MSNPQKKIENKRNWEKNPQKEEIMNNDIKKEIYKNIELYSWNNQLNKSIPSASASIENEIILLASSKEILIEAEKQIEQSNF